MTPNSPVSIAGTASDDETWDYTSCAQATRYSSYTAATGHQIPRDWFAAAAMAYFRSK